MLFCSNLSSFYTCKYLGDNREYYAINYKFIKVK